MYKFEIFATTTTTTTHIPTPNTKTIKHILTRITTWIRWTTTTTTTNLQTKMFSLYIYWSNCDPDSESLHHSKCSAISGKITIYKSLNKALLALRYSLLVRNVAAEIIGNTLFSTSVYVNTIHYTHRFFITRIYAYVYINNTYLQYWQ